MSTVKFEDVEDLAGTLTFNGASGGRKNGGTMASSITITEYKPNS